MTLVLITAPAVEPVTVTEMRAQLRLASTAEDAVLDGFIKAAREHVERETRRALIRQSWRYYLESWPEGRVVALPLSPVEAVEAVTVYALDGTARPLAPEDYALSRVTAPARLRVKIGSGPPLAELLGIEVEFTAGYGPAATDVPEVFRQAVRLLAAHWFENREAGTDLVLASLPHGLDRLLSVNRVLSL